MSCICQECRGAYRIDLIVDDPTWELIKPTGKPIGGGLLCGKCIIEKLEILGNYAVFKKEDLSSINRSSYSLNRIAENYHITNELAEETKSILEKTGKLAAIKFIREHGGNRNLIHCHQLVTSLVEI